MSIETIFSLITLILTVLTGCVFYSLATKHIVRYLFYAAFILAIALNAGIYMLFWKIDSGQSSFWTKYVTSGFCLMLPLFVGVSLVYARQNFPEILKQRIWLFSIISASSLFFLILNWIEPFSEIKFYQGNAYFEITTIGRYFLVFVLLVSVLILIHLESTFRSSQHTARYGKKAILIVMFVNFLFAVYITSHLLMFETMGKSLVLTGMGIIIISHIFFLIYLAKYGLTQFEVKIGRQAVYSSATIFIVGSYLILIGIIGQIVRSIGGDMQTFFTVLAAFLVFVMLLAILVSKSLKRRIRAFIDRNFYRNKYDYREQWGKFSESLSEVVNIEDVLETILEYITQIFQVRHVAILLKDTLSGSFKLWQTKNQPFIDQIKFEPNSRFLDWLFRLGEPLEISGLIQNPETSGITKEEISHFETLDVRVCIPLIVQKKFIGILVLGPKIDDGLFSLEDFDLLDTLGNQSSVAILNARLNENLVQTREMESFHKLSSFVLHDIKNSVSTLSLVVQNAGKNWDNEEFQQDMLITITNTVNKMKSLISRLSTLPDRLELNCRQIHLQQLIEDVITDVKLAHQQHIKIKRDYSKLPVLEADPELLKKVIKNLIINAIEALANEGQLSFTIRRAEQLPHLGEKSIPGAIEHDFAELIVSDSGCGMSQKFIQQNLFKPFQTTKRKGLGIGLYQSKEIVQAHGGAIEVYSKRDEGTQFKIYLPMTTNHQNIEN
ncbi:PEP-CTERM system histidine kinase PrsK [candidate division KSB1 bacterium]|nr:PEP-CTERM system histidine kinase PrsK [candidate division KSB1 bacterium]